MDRDAKPSGTDPEPDHRLMATYHGWYDIETAEGIDIREIIRGLAYQVRYAGQTHKPYSIAQHSCLCHQWAKAEGLSPELRRAALLHDAAEAYCKDLPRPLKRAVGGYAEVIRRAEKRIATLYQYPYPLPSVIDQIDHRVYLAERQGIASHPDIDTCIGAEVPGSVTRLMTSVWPAETSAGRLARRIVEELEPGAAPQNWADADEALKKTYGHFIPEHARM